MHRAINSILCGLLIFISMVMTGVVVMAAPMNSPKAKKAVKAWLKTNKKPLNVKLGNTAGDIQTYCDNQGTALYYVVSLEPSGFVIVSADDLIEPIIAFSSEGKFDPSTNGPLGALLNSDLRNRIEEAHNQESSISKGGKFYTIPGRFSNVRNKWKRFTGDSATSINATTLSISSVSDVRVEPFIQSRWNQQNECGYATYNYYTPPGDEGSPVNYPCGCVATAVAQVMRFFQYPTAGVGTGSYTIQVDDVSQTRSLRGGDGAGGAYQWSNMTLDPDCSITTTQRQAIGALCYDISVASEMDYHSNGSGADLFTTVNAMKSVFGYTNAVDGFNSNQTITTGLPAMMNPNLDAGYPVIIGIVTSSQAGHAVIADGYGYDSSTLYHHLNMGWSGYSDAWYNLPSVSAAGYTFTTLSACIYNIYTSGNGEIISGRVLNSSGSPISGATVTAVRNGTTYATATTNSKGIYALKKLPSGKSYTLSVQSTSYTFTSRAVNVGISSNYNPNSGNQWGVDFTAQSPAPTVSSFAINNGSETATSLTVTLNNTCTNSPAYYMASESSSFTGASWQTYSTAPSFTLSSGGGTKTVYFKVKNSSGIESSVVSDSIVVESTPPVTTANPGGGVYTTFKSIMLTPSETATIYYTINGSEPTSSSSIYLNAIPISSDTTLKYYAIDTVGNIESTKQENYYILSGNGSIADVKSAVNGASVRLGGKSLYLNRSSYGYIEEPQRFNGIRIQGNITGNKNDLVNLVGSVIATAGIERYIQILAMTSDGTQQLSPLGITNRTLLLPLVDGLFVTAWGIVKSGSVIANSFIISDGSDSTGIKIITTSAPTVSEGSFVSISGAAGYENGQRVIYTK